MSALKVYIRAAHFQTALDPQTGSHDITFRYRFVLSPDQDARTVFELIDLETKGILQRAFGQDVEFIKPATLPESCTVQGIGDLTYTMTDWRKS